MTLTVGQDSDEATNPDKLSPTRNDRHEVNKNVLVPLISASTPLQPPQSPVAADVALHRKYHAMIAFGGRVLERRIGVQSPGRFFAFSAARLAHTTRRRLAAEAAPHSSLSSRIVLLHPPFGLHA